MVMKGLFIIIFLALLVIMILQTTQLTKKGDDGSTALSAIDKAKLLTIDSTVRNIIAALDSYFSLHNENPENLTMLIPQFIRSEMDRDSSGDQFSAEKGPDGP